MQEDRKIWLSKIKRGKIIGKDNCPFCKLDSSKNEILKELNHWFIIKNRYPYNGEEKHLLVIPKKHKDTTDKLSLEEYKEFKKVSKFMKEYYKGENYFSFIRETNGGKSIEHLHYHYLPGILYSTKLEKILK